MANMEVGTPRFYTDVISYNLSRGGAQNGKYDVTATHAGNTLMGTFTTGSEAELFDMNPLNKVTFDTSADTDAHVLITIDTGGTTKVSYIAILNHNLATAVGKIRIFAGDEPSDVTAINAGNAETGDINWDNQAGAQVLNADTMGDGGNGAGGGDGLSMIVIPGTDGSTIFKFTETSMRYWGIQFEGNTSASEQGTSDGTWGSTDFFVGCICLGEIFEMPHAPDASINRSIAFDKVNVQESIGGKRYSNAASLGRSATSTTSSPFSVATEHGHIYGGRIIYDLNFSFIASSDLMPAEYSSISSTDDSVIGDVWNRTNGSMIPFIFSIDKDADGATNESEHIFARFANNSLDMKQVANGFWNVSMRIEEEF